MCQLYKDIPKRLTTFKFGVINQYGYQQRLIGLGLSSAVIGILAFRKAKGINIPAATLKSFKDAVVVYFGLGLVLAP